MEFGQTLSVVIEQKIFGFRLEQAELPWAPRSSSSKLILCQKNQQSVSSQKRRWESQGFSSRVRSRAERQQCSFPCLTTLPKPCSWKHVHSGQGSGFASLPTLPSTSLLLLNLFLLPVEHLAGDQRSDDDFLRSAPKADHLEHSIIPAVQRGNRSGKTLVLLGAGSLQDTQPLLATVLSPCPGLLGSKGTPRSSM